jgi:hypothetical protein
MLPAHIVRLIANFTALGENLRLSLTPNPSPRERGADSFTDNWNKS